MSPQRKENESGSISDHSTKNAIVQRDSEELPEQSQPEKIEAKERCENNIERGRQGFVDGDEENESEKYEELEREKEDDRQQDDNGSPMGHSNASSSGVIGVGGRHADAFKTRDDKHVDAQEKINMFENTPFTGPSYPSSPSCSRCKCKECKDSQDKLFEKVEAISKGPFKKVEICAELSAKEKWDLRRSKNAKRVMSVNDIHYWAVEILLEEGKIKVYDCNEPAIDEVILFIHMQPLMELFPILLRESKLMNHFLKKVLIKKSWDFEGQKKGMNLPKNDTGFVSGSHTLVHIECLLTNIEMAEPMTFLCDNSMENLQEF
ncbi:hypothetical protein FXO37_34528 [Capsicum annuum]|nr:hypothetical protein FXO37_34528 [Capsicum annuum]